MMRLAIFGAIGAAVFFVANVLFMPVGTFIPPSRFYFNERFSAQFASYFDRGRVDYLIMGSSRVRDGFDPGVFAETLSRSLGRAVSAHSLAAAGGYFLFYEAVLTELIANNLPTNLVLGIVPRDFNRREGRRFETRDALYRSPGYRLARLPYEQPGRYLEQRLTDLTAAILPALHYWRDARALLIPQGLLDYARPTPERPPSPLRTYVWSQIRFFGAGNRLPANWPRVQENIGAFPRRLNAVFSWSPSAVSSVNELGYYPLRPESPEDRARRMARQQKKWAELVSTGLIDKYRYSDYCETRMRVDQSPNSTHRRVFAFLMERGVRVYLVNLPGIWFEGCENNMKYNKELVDYIREDIMSKYKNIISFTDLNNNFSHEFSDVKFYQDLEHISPGQSAAITRKIAAAIARASN